MGSFQRYADVVELADTLDLGSSVARLAGSTPVIRTIDTYVIILVDGYLNKCFIV